MSDPTRDSLLILTVASAPRHDTPHEPYPRGTVVPERTVLWRRLSMVEQ